MPKKDISKSRMNRLGEAKEKKKNGISLGTLD